MVGLRILPLAGLVITLGLLAGCTDSAREDADGPTGRPTERVSTTPLPSSSPLKGPPPMPRASKAATLSVEHCWIDPVRFDGHLWAVAPDDQFGAGGGTPANWEDRGLITRVGDSRSRYEDKGGAVLRLVLAPEPEAAQVFEQGCD